MEITVNAIMPGAFDAHDRTIPAGRMPGATGIPQSDKVEGTPRDPANVAPDRGFLASDDAANVTGNVSARSGVPHHALSAHRARQGSLQQRSVNVDELFERLKNTLLVESEPARM